MGYLPFSGAEPALGLIGCGTGCSCLDCRRVQSGFGEWYIEDEDDSEVSPRRDIRPAREPAEAQVDGGWGEPAPSGPSPAVVLDRFEFDRADLLTAPKPQIIAIARGILASQATAAPVRTLRIVGHTDPRGTEAYNLDLGRRRAAAVSRAFFETLGRLRPDLIWPSRLTIVLDTRGETQPI